MGNGSFFFFCLSLFVAIAASAAPIGIPESLSVQIVYRECHSPKETEDKNTPFENARACVFSGEIETNAKDATIDRSGVVKVKPELVFSLGEEDRKLSLPWIEARAFAAYISRVHTERQITFVEMEDGTWSKATSLGLHVDLTTEKLTVPFKLLELTRNYSGKGHVDVGVIEIPLEALANRVFTKPSTLSVTEDLDAQHFFVNYNLDHTIPIVVLGFESGAINPKPAGPLTHLLPGYRAGNHSAIIAVRAELNNADSKSVGLYRLPVGLLRTVPQGKLEDIYAKALGVDASLQWLNEMNIGAISVPQNKSDRVAVLRQYLNSRHTLAMSFDMVPAQECRAQIAR